MGKKANNDGKFVRCVKAPYRLLCRARDFYVHSLTDCAGRVSTGHNTSSLPKSFSVNSSRSTDVDEDLRELIRAVSKNHSSGNKIDVNLLGQQQLRKSATVSTGVPMRFSVGIGRIDEDKPCDFEGDIKVNTDLKYPRSRSYAVTKRNVAFS
ncbi:hypothetical protein HHK36_009746 [Tetracentron sinense]|uniref:Uncharacterized protein n=1 Tax=Tetracentron sinense TaxID=13715 RepID=A0A834ZJJ1_TETSI|nr:hypothetical protein HHK36_009746 [Tetracentron sinense]